MANYTWNLSAGVNSDIATHAVLPAVNVASPEKQDWTLNAAAAGSEVTVDEGKTVVVNGGAGVDTVHVTSTTGGVTVNGGAGADLIDLVGATATINGGAGADTITLDATSVAKISYDALDKVTAAVGSKITLDASAASKAVNWDLSVAPDTTGGATVAAGAIAFGAGSSVTATNIVSVVGSTFADTLTAGTTAVTLDGGAGADTLVGSATAATTFVYDAADASVDGKGLGILDASAQTTGIELVLENNKVFTGLASVIGGAGNDVIRGTAGVATINGGKGNDLIWGGSAQAANTLTGGQGADEFWIGYNEGNDVISYDSHLDTASNKTVSDSKDDVVHLYNVSALDLVGEGVFTNGAADGTITYATFAGGSNETLTLAGAAGNADAVRHFTSEEGWSFDVAFAGAAAGSKATGTAGVIDNLIAGTLGSTLDGKGGNDNLYGSAAADTFVFHAGDQIYSGGGADVIDATTATAGVSIFTADLLAGKTAATSWAINGSKFDDNIRGTAVADTIVAGDGNDLIWAGAGVVTDTITGGRGVDTYYYGLDEGNDVITAGGNKYDGNALDTVNFYNVAKVDDLSGTLAANGKDLVISVAGTQGVGTLTLNDWNATDALNKLTNVVVGGAGYTVSYNTDLNKAVFTAVK